MSFWVILRMLWALCLLEFLVGGWACRAAGPRTPILPMATNCCKTSPARRGFPMITKLAVLRGGDGSSDKDDETMIRRDIAEELQHTKRDLKKYGTGGEKQLRSCMNSFADGIVEDVQERKLFKAAAKAASKQTKEAMKMKPTLGACLLCSASLAEGCTLDGTHWESLIPQESDVEFPSPGVTGISEAFGAVSQQGGAVFVSAGEHKTRGGCAIEVTSLGQGGSSNLVVVGRMAAKVCARWFLAGESRGSISNLALQNAPLPGDDQESTVTIISGPWKLTACEIMSSGGVALCSASPLTSLHRCRLGGSSPEKDIGTSCCAILATAGRLVVHGCLIEDVGGESASAVIIGGGVCVQASHSSVRRVSGSAFAIQGVCHISLDESEIHVAETETVFSSLSRKNCAQVDIKGCSFVGSSIFSPDSHLPKMLNCDQDPKAPLMTYE